MITHQPAPQALTIRLDSVAEAVAAMAAGRAVVVVDDERRENEGDIIFAAQFATPALVGWTVRYTSGVLCVPISGVAADRLLLPPMTAVNEDAKGTAYTVSCDAAVGISTGISAADRAVTARLLADPTTTAADLTRPGHMFPLRGAPGGVGQRPGHTEAGLELCALAGLEPAAVIAEVVHDEGHMMRLPDLRDFADSHGVPLISIKDLLSYLSDPTRDEKGLR
ncbi:3,4-dihydroxy-2-butanone-4-phosphate synthase [Arthrobacter flavus]|uniref:3,4-dihydroxy-2-butanone 4-phosphate synthase n=1 Tax=Arthrobacter flavus TaxID=95172 RepID=A0ABW4QBV9_9MICC